MKPIHRILALLLGTILVGCRPAGLEGEIGRYLSQAAEAGTFSGAVLVARDGQPILRQAHGLANRAYDVPNQVDTRFNLGSMNKMFTAVVVLQLAEQGKLDLAARIVDYLPDYPNREVAERVSVHHLLTHTSGLGDFFNQRFFDTPRDRLRSLQDYLPLFADQPLQFEPGARHSYSNAGFLVLGLIIESASGQSYYDAVRQQVFQPCGMANTGFYETDDVVPNLAVGYSRVIEAGGSLRSNLLVNPVKGSSAGGGYSTVEDLLSFSNALVSHQLLSPAWTDALFEGRVEGGDLPDEAWRGYGFIVRRAKNGRIVGHSGGAPGVCSNLDIYLDQGYTAAVLSNSDYDCRYVTQLIREKLSE